MYILISLKVILKKGLDNFEKLTLCNFVNCNGLLTFYFQFLFVLNVIGIKRCGSKASGRFQLWFHVHRHLMDLYNWFQCYVSKSYKSPNKNYLHCLVNHLFLHNSWFCYLKWAWMFLVWIPVTNFLKKSICKIQYFIKLNYTPNTFAAISKTENI